MKDNDMSRYTHSLAMVLVLGVSISQVASGGCNPFLGADPLHCTSDMSCGNGLVCDLPTETCKDPTMIDAPTGEECLPACVAPTPACDDGMCVECTSDENCDGSQCDTRTNTCVPCIDNEFCDSRICNDNDDGDNGTNVCVDPMQIYYVEPVGSDMAPCGRREVAMEMPCTSINAVLTNPQRREWIHIEADTDDYPEPGQITINNTSGTMPLRIVGQTDPTGGIGVSILAADAVRMMLIEGTAPPPVSFEGIALNGGEKGADSVLKCSSAGGVLNLYNTKLANGAESAKGLIIEGCTLRMERTLVESNGGGGVDINGASFTLYNNIILRNMNGDGVKIDSPMQPAILEFNTISGNGGSSGITCVGVPSMTASHNIVDHTGDTDVVGCNAVMAGANSLIDTDVTLSPDGHLNAKSGDAIDGGAESHPDVTEDFDGEPRPEGDTNYDIGADEFYR